VKRVVKVIGVLILLLITGCGEKERLFIEDIVEERDGPYSQGVETHRIKYGSGGLKIGGYLVIPKDIEGKLPVIIYNRGGNRNYGLIDKNLNHLEYLASNGYIVLASQYRGNIYSEGRDEYGGGDVDDIKPGDNFSR